MTEPMRILWTVNIPLPAASTALGLPESPFGGWLTTMTCRLARVAGVQLGIAMRSPVESMRFADVDGIRYYALPQSGKGGLDARSEDCARILADFKPDILHAEGSEMAYTRRMLAAWNGPRLLSLQGVVNGIAPFYLGGLNPGKALRSLRLRQVGAMVALALNKWLRFRPRLKDERDAIAMVDHIIGRTPWDHAHAWVLNPRATYYHCGRTLRSAFYGARWQLAASERHTIFVGNAAVALKGTHVLLDALLLLHREYPKVRLVIAGESANAKMKRPSQYFGYPAFLRDRIKELGLDAHVHFTGVLDEQAMVGRMLQSHVYVMSSIIENSPNTLGEAMMLGMPCVSAYAGGAPGMARDESEALFYRAEDPVTLAWQIKRLFDSDTLCERLGEAAHARAVVTHDADANLQDLLTAYRTILMPGASL